MAKGIPLVSKARLPQVVLEKRIFKANLSLTFDTIAGLAPGVLSAVRAVDVVADVVSICRRTLSYKAPREGLKKKGS